MDKKLDKIYILLKHIQLIFCPINYIIYLQLLSFTLLGLIIIIIFINFIHHLNHHAF